MDAGTEWPFQGENLYSLLVMGLVPFLLQSLPFKEYSHPGIEPGERMEADEPDKVKAAKNWLEHYDPTTKSAESPGPSAVFLTAVRHEMVEVSNMIVSLLPPSDMEQFQQFWTSVRSLFIDEYMSRCKYNHS